MLLEKKIQFILSEIGRNSLIDNFNSLLIIVNECATT